MKKTAVLWPSYFLAAVLAFLYNDWLLGYFLNPHMSANRSLISELSAITQPYHWVFQTLDITAGILTLLCASYVWRLAGKTTPEKRLLLTAFFVFVGVDSIVDASLPISCAPSVNQACRLFASHSVLTNAHLVESNIAGVAIAIAPAIWWWWHRAGKHRPIATASLWLLVLETFVGIAALIVRFAGVGYYGGIQRLYQGGVGLWIGLLVYSAITAHTETKQTTQPSSAPDQMGDAGAAS